MKKNSVRFLAAIVCCLLSWGALAQKNQPKFDVRLGVGLLPTFLKDKTKTMMPPVILSADYFVRPNFSLGLFLGHSASNTRVEVQGDGQPMQCRNNLTVTGLRAAVHTTGHDKWSAYGGLTVGYAHSQVMVLQGDVEKLVKHNNYKEHSGKPLLTAFVGGRYALSPRIGIFGELGYSISLLTLGGSYRF